jgi:hypothetical protein
VEVGEALLTIRDNRLYRASHATFEEYCDQRWGFNRDIADRTIRSAEVAGILRPTGRIPNEAQARELAPLRDDPAVVRAVWADIVEQEPKPTAAAVRERVQRLQPARRDRVDVVGLMAEAVTYADRAARAADQINKGHLETRRQDVPTWRTNLSRSIGSLRALEELLGEME